jgi:hypothetical protein
LTEINWTCAAKYSKSKGLALFGDAKNIKNSWSKLVAVTVLALHAKAGKGSQLHPAPFQMTKVGRGAINGELALKHCMHLTSNSEIFPIQCSPPNLDLVLDALSSRTA